MKTLARRIAIVLSATAMTVGVMAAVSPAEAKDSSWQYPIQGESSFRDSSWGKP